MRRKILIVDDEPNVLAGLERSLRKDYEIETALDGETALKKLTLGSGYAVVVSDQLMPRMDGI